jgi:hypothetical protein
VAVVWPTAEKLKDFNESTATGRRCFGEWDVLKGKIKNFAQHSWEAHVRKRGAAIGKLRAARSRAETNLNKTGIHNPNRRVALNIYRAHNLALEVALARDLEERTEVANTNWISTSGKPHKDFLRKPRGKNSKVRSMTIDNVKNAPDLP